MTEYTIIIKILAIIYMYFSSIIVHKLNIFNKNLHYNKENYLPTIITNTTNIINFKSIIVPIKYSFFIFNIFCICIT